MSQDDRSVGVVAGRRPRDRRWQRYRTTGLVVLVVLSATSCLITPVPGDPPLRYRDVIFSSVSTTTDVVYGSAIDQLGNTVDLKLDLYQPAGDTVTSRPLIIWIHGGYFSGGDKTSVEIVDEATTFAEKGYVTASINYRLSPNGCRAPIGAECVQAIYDANADAQTAVRFLRSVADANDIDPSRVAIAGTSAGAMTALNVGFGLASPGAPPPSASSQVGAAMSLSGAEIFTAAVDSSDAPALMFHGTADLTVPFAWATATANAGKAAGVEVDLIPWDGDGHAPYDLHRDAIIALTTNFMYNALDDDHAAR